MQNLFRRFTLMIDDDVTATKKFGRPCIRLRYSCNGCHAHKTDIRISEGFTPFQLIDTMMPCDCQKEVFDDDLEEVKIED